MTPQATSETGVLEVAPEEASNARLAGGRSKGGTQARNEARDHAQVGLVRLA